MGYVERKSATNLINISNEATIYLAPAEMHQNWVRWCYASINKHFEDGKSKYELYQEGDERTESEEAEFAELRMDGPFILCPQKNLYFLDIEINVLCQTHMDPRNFYEAQVMVGVFTSLFTNCIPVYKYGNSPLDDDSLLGDFKLNRDTRETVDVSYFGIVRSGTRLTQTTIEGHYRLQLWTGDD